VAAFRRPLLPWTLCLAPAAPAAAPASAPVKSDALTPIDAARDFDGEAGRLYSHYEHVIVEFDLALGRVRAWRAAGTVLTAMAIASDGVRLFVVDKSISELDTGTGVMKPLMTAADRPSLVPGERPAIYSMGLAIDRQAGALLFTKPDLQCVSRLCGIQP
jgi:hypothetical protein